MMTLDEKITMLHGVAGPYVGNVPANTRLGIPALNLNDGACGHNQSWLQVCVCVCLCVPFWFVWFAACLQQFGGEASAVPCLSRLSLLFLHLVGPCECRTSRVPRQCASRHNHVLAKWPDCGRHVGPERREGLGRRHGQSGQTTFAHKQEPR